MKKNRDIAGVHLVIYLIFNILFYINIIFFFANEFLSFFL